MDEDVALSDRLWATVSVASGLIAFNGLLLLGVALSDGSPIPAAFGLVALVLGALGCRAAWHRTIWADVTRRTGVGYRQQQRTRNLRPREIVLLRVLLIGVPVLIGALAVVTDRSWADLLISLVVIVAVSITTMAPHQRDQLLGRD